MVAISCLCNGVRIDAPIPDFVHECNCTLCAKSGARWGYYHPDQVRVTGATNGFSRTDKDEASVQIRFCPTCGTTTHFVLTKSAQARLGDTMMGVNMALVDETDLAGIELRFPDGRRWSGAGGFDYIRPARIYGRN